MIQQHDAKIQYYGVLPVDSVSKIMFLAYFPYFEK
jgi:hypothetical protein